VDDAGAGVWLAGAATLTACPAPAPTAG